MSDAYTAEPRRGRPAKAESDRATEIKQRRRRRQDLGPNRGRKLFVPDDAKDPNFEYRFINNRPGRVQQLTQMDDYDIVSSAEMESRSLGTTVERVANRDGESMILVRKPKEFYEADKAEAAKALDATEEAMRSGPAPSSEGLAGPDAYVPSGRNVVNGR